MKTNKHTTIEKEELWHYLRICKWCSYKWEGTHCPHDGVQNPCPECGKRPVTIEGKCNCEFEI